MNIIDKIYYKNYIIAANSPFDKAFDLVAYKNTTDKCIKSFSYIKGIDFESGYYCDDYFSQTRKEIEKIKKKINEEFKDVEKLENTFQKLVNDYLSREFKSIIPKEAVWENISFIKDFNFDEKKFKKKGKLVKELNTISFSCKTETHNRFGTITYNLDQKFGDVSTYTSKEASYGNQS